MSPIAKALHRQTPAERLDTTIYMHSFPEITYEYAMLMLLIVLKMTHGAAVRAKGGTA